MKKGLIEKDKRYLTNIMRQLCRKFYKNLLWRICFKIGKHRGVPYGNDTCFYTQKI